MLKARNKNAKSKNLTQCHISLKENEKKSPNETEQNAGSQHGQQRRPDASAAAVPGLRGAGRAAPAGQWAELGPLLGSSPAAGAESSPPCLCLALCTCALGIPPVCMAVSIHPGAGSLGESELPSPRDPR